MSISAADRARINRRNGARRFSRFWTEKRVAVLRAGWATGQLTIEIAFAIGGGCTRQMVIGKAKRLKLGNALDRVSRGQRTSEGRQLARRRKDKNKHRRFRVAAVVEALT